jgi:hypothetical protein
MGSLKYQRDAFSSGTNHFTKEDIHSDSQSGWSTTGKNDDVEKMQHLVHTDQRMIAEKLGMSKECVSNFNHQSLNVLDQDKALGHNVVSVR